ncbi:beta strand repeat-containing protein [Leptospira alstonii]|uniref:Bacterial Ig-like domain, group 2 n=2 Tax=Leptospira alstonii TaxID=28452 RepID=M6CW29_9LEPT|nr:Ig-like domain-containing protein [Leptospira alstonii]EMJ93118.1 bacterial Ig-like domain, group 2 [Leptospira alstonii serovar Sichuan str. 79601]EQA78456.1 bacterial Ig-like domain, group 2 [Leptospira alstonii serovar Pingchang str. 80-412]
MFKKILSIVSLFLFLQGCTAWPILTGALGLAAGKKKGDNGLFGLSFLGNSQPAALKRIEIATSESAIAKGTSTQIQVTAIFEDGTHSEITSSSTILCSNSTILDCQNAAGKGVGIGTADITAKYQGQEASASVRVTNAVLVSLQLSSVDSGNLPVGFNRDYTLIGVFSDNTTQDLTLDTSANYTSTNPNAAALSANGRGLTGVSFSSTTTLVASFGGKATSVVVTTAAVSLVSIQITPVNPSVPLGGNRQFTATGIFSDLSQADITASVSWNSSQNAVATINSSGLVSSQSVGNSTISASNGAITSNTQSFTVTAAQLTSISITPSNLSLPKGLSQQFTATGLFTDNSTLDITSQVNWTSSDNTLVSISNAPGTEGNSTSVSPGAVTITADIGGISGSVTMTATNASLVSISVTPANPSLPKGLTQQFTATGTYSDNSTQDLTAVVVWSSSAVSKASVSNGPGIEGRANALTTGTTSIKATHTSGIFNSTTLTVTPAVLSSIQVTPTNPSIANGYTKQFSATGTYSDNSTQDLSLVATWTSSANGVATVSNATGSEGLATSLSIGTTNIKATYNSITSPASTLTVTAAVLVSISVTPGAPSKGKGLTQQFLATGNYSDSSTADLTNSVTWTSSDSITASISNAVGTKGKANALETGTSSIQAALGGISSSAVTFTVTSASLVSISVTPANPGVPKGLTQQFTATGTYSDGSVQVITDSITWSSSATGFATISNAVGSQGLANTDNVGATTITATDGTVSGTSTLTVTAASLVSISVSPTSPTIDTTTTKQFFATGTYTDASTQDLTTAVTWSSSNVPSATVSNATGSVGLATGVAAGNSSIKATLGALFGATNLTVNTIDLTPPTVLSVISLTARTVRVTFSEPVNTAQATNTNNYKIANSGGLSPTASCANNSDFTGNNQTGTFNLTSIVGNGSVFTITLNNDQVSGAPYTLLVNKAGIQDLATTPNSFGCPNNADFIGQEKIKVSSAICSGLKEVTVAFSKTLLAGTGVGGAECTTSVECAKRYKIVGVSAVGNITNAKILDGTVCGGAPADPTKVCLTHLLDQSGGQYTILAANNVDGDGFNNTAWGAVQHQNADLTTENLQTSPKDRTIFIGCGTAPVNFVDGPIAVDPFGDASSFGYITNYNNKIYIGPNGGGNQAVRFNYDGTVPESVSFSFMQDLGSGFRNTAVTRDGGIPVPRYVTMGHTLCNPNTAHQATGCGPDNEDGRGVFTAGTLGGTPHLLIAGARSAENFNYIYYTSDTDAGLDFKYIDTGSITGTVAAGTSALSIMNDRIYGGFAKKNSSGGSNSPDFGKISFNTADNVPNTINGHCDVGSDCEAGLTLNGTNLRLNYMPNFGGGSTGGDNASPNWAKLVGVDSLFVFNNRIYAANGGNHAIGHNGTIIRSNNGNPIACAGNNLCAEWTEIGPRADAKWHNGAAANWYSLELVSTYDLIPSDKAFAQFAEFNGNLYVTRTLCNTAQAVAGFKGAVSNIAGCTTAGFGNRRPQLWKCDPTNGGTDAVNPTTCEANEWSVVGDDNNGFTNFGDGNNHSATMLVTNGSHLYVGFDNGAGVQIWRTKAGVTNPGANSTDWEQIGGNGLGDAANNTQIFSGTSANTINGTKYIYVSTGKGGVPMRIFRQQNN